MSSPTLPAAIEELWIDPTDAAFLYTHCVRCLYLHAHGWTRIEPSSASHAELVEGTMAVAQSEGRWLALENDERFRVLSARETVNSATIPLTSLGVALGFNGRYDAIVELRDGRRLLTKYALAGDDAEMQRIAFELAVYGFALGHPAQGAERGRVGIDGYAVLHFGVRDGVLVPVRLTELQNRTEGLLDFIRLLARVATRETEPAAAPDCARCARG